MDSFVRSLLEKDFPACLDQESVLYKDYSLQEGQFPKFIFHVIAHKIPCLFYISIFDCLIWTVF